MAEAAVPPWAWGIIGGAFAEVLRWYRLRETLHKALPGFAHDWKYWTVTALMAGIGGLLVVMHGSEVQMTPMLAANIGASAPLILSAMAERTPEVVAVEQEKTPIDLPEDDLDSK